MVLSSDRVMCWGVIARLAGLPGQLGFADSNLGPVRFCYLSLLYPVNTVSGH